MEMEIQRRALNVPQARLPPSHFFDCAETTSLSSRRVEGGASCPLVSVEGLFGDGSVFDVSTVRTRLDQFPVLHSPPGYLPVWKLEVSCSPVTEQERVAVLTLSPSDRSVITSSSACCLSSSQSVYRNPMKPNPNVVCVFTLK